MPIDPLLSVLVALIISRSALSLIKDSAHILLEGAPEGIDRRDIKRDLLETIPGLVSVDHIHAWSISQDRPMLTLEASVAQDQSLADMRDRIKQRLHAQFHIDHVTVDIRREPTNRPG